MKKPKTDRRYQTYYYVVFPDGQVFREIQTLKRSFAVAVCEMLDKMNVQYKFVKSHKLAEDVPKKMYLHY